MKKKILFIFISVIMFFAVISEKPVFLSAEVKDSGSCGENVYYTLDDTGTLIISGQGRINDYGSLESVIPWENNRNFIKTVIIKQGITRIGDAAFSYCVNLTSVTLPESLTEIGNIVFGECHSLESIIIPDSVTSVGVGVFWNCKALKEVKLPDCITNLDFNFFYYCESLNSVVLPENLNYIGAGIFEGCFSLKSIIIPDKVTAIYDTAFKNCSSLESVVIPDGVTHISKEAFENCSSLGTISIPSSVTHIGKEAFKNCSSLGPISIPSSVTSIGENAFFVDSYKGIIIYCSRNSYIADYAELNGIPYVMVDGNDEESILRGNLTENALWTLDKRTGLLEITGEGSLPAYGKFENQNGVFYKYRNYITKVKLNGKFKSIGNYLFKFLWRAETIEMPDCITYIGREAFFRCSSLKTLTVPSDVKEIEGLAFGYCENLEELNFALDENNLSGLSSIFDDIFSDCPKLKNITVPASVDYIRADALPSELETLTICNPECNIERTCISGDKVEIIGFKGSSAEKFAENNGYKFTDIETVHTHRYKICEVRYKPTCSEPGTQIKRCSCGKYEKIEIPVLPHTPGKPVIENKTEATCTEPGHYDEVIYCTICDALISRTEKEIPIKNHTVVKDKAVAPTCTENGLTEGSHCSVCGKVIKAQKALSAAGHKWDKGRVTKAPTVTENGIKTYKCTVCGAVNTKAIPKLSFIPGDADKNGQITAADARLALRASVELEPQTAELIKISDMDADGKITAADARLILRLSVGLK